MRKDTAEKVLERLVELHKRAVGKRAEKDPQFSLLTDEDYA